MSIEKEYSVMKQIKDYLGSSKHARRLYRKLQLRRVMYILLLQYIIFNYHIFNTLFFFSKNAKKVKRSSNIPIFNIDKYIKYYLSSKVELTPINKIKFKRVQFIILLFMFIYVLILLVVYCVF